MIKSDYDYYVDELTSLKRDGKVFADKYPEAAKQLNLGIADNLDPSVERIIESTAFLIGKIKKTTDESLHEISDYLLNFFYPLLLKDIPSYAIVEFKGKEGLIAGGENIPKGTCISVYSLDSSKESIKYSTVTDCEITGLEIVNSNLDDMNGMSYLDIEFHINKSFNLDIDNFKSIKMFIKNEYSKDIALALRFFLLNYLSNIKFIINGKSYNSDLKVKSTEVDDCFSSFLNNNCEGLGIQYFFASKDIFNFIEIVNFSSGILKIIDDSFILRFEFSRKFPLYFNYSTNLFCLHCAPIINLYKEACEPIKLQPTQNTYDILITNNKSKNKIIHELLSVTSSNDIKFYNIVDRKSSTLEANCYYVLRNNDNYKLVLCNQFGLSQKMILSIEANVTNEISKESRYSELSGITLQSERSFLESTKFIVFPTPNLKPVNNDENKANLLSLLSFNMNKHFELNDLHNVLKIFIRDKVDSNYLKVFGIQKYKKHVITRLNRGCLEKGYRIELEISSQSFSGEFDCLLFSEQIYKFLKKFVDVNLFIELEVLIKPSGSAYIFK